MISKNTHRGSSLISAIKEWLPERTKTIDVLRNEANSIVVHRFTTAVLTIGAVGLALAPFTAGTSLAVAAGAAAGVAVGGTALGISLYLEGRNYVTSQEIVVKDRYLCNTVNERMESVSNFCEDICITFTAFDKHEAFELVLAAHIQVEDLCWSGKIASARQLHLQIDRSLLDYLLTDKLPNDLRAWIGRFLEAIGKTQTVNKLRNLADQLEKEKKKFERFENLSHEAAPTAIEQAVVRPSFI